MSHQPVVFRIGTRRSPLAMKQTREAADALRAAYPGCVIRLIPVTTKGDRDLARPLADLGGKGAFTQAIEEQILDGTIDLAVHSLKDMPAELAPGLAITAVMKRSEGRDVLVSPKYGSLEELPPGASVGTSSLRRTAQILHLRPDLQVRNLRGNIETRVRKVEEGEYDAAILAGAGLERLDLGDKIRSWLPESEFLPAGGQGAIAVESRSEDDRMVRLLSVLNDPATRAETAAERRFLMRVGGSCQIPAGVSAQIDGDRMTVDGMIASPDGCRCLRETCAGPAVRAEDLGRELADRLLDAGGREILRDLGLEEGE